MAGLKPYEIITEVNGQPVTGAKQFGKMLEAGGELRLQVQRMNQGRVVKVRMDEAKAESSPPPTNRPSQTPDPCGSARPWLWPTSHAVEKPMDYTLNDIAKMIDHSLLKPTMTEDVLEEGLKVALKYDVASVCIMPFYVKRCTAVLEGSTVQSSTVIGFPHGGHNTVTKLYEAKMAIADGATELDAVVNISKVLSGDWEYVREELGGMTAMTHEAGRKIKVIFENCYLNDDQKIRLCEICTDLGVNWVKTSTGYGTSGATIDDLKLMRKHAGTQVQVKAAGGVRDFDTLLACREVGCSRVGASATEAILAEAQQTLSDAG